MNPETHRQDSQKLTSFLIGTQISQAKNDEFQEEEIDQQVYNESNSKESILKTRNFCPNQDLPNKTLHSEQYDPKQHFKHVATDAQKHNDPGYALESNIPQINTKFDIPDNSVYKGELPNNAGSGEYQIWHSQHMLLRSDNDRTEATNQNHYQKKTRNLDRGIDEFTQDNNYPLYPYGSTSENQTDKLINPFISQNLAEEIICKGGLKNAARTINDSNLQDVFQYNDLPEKNIKDNVNNNSSDIDVINSKPKLSSDDQNNRLESKNFKSSHIKYTSGAFENPRLQKSIKEQFESWPHLVNYVGNIQQTSYRQTGEMNVAQEITKNKNSDEGQIPSHMSILNFAHSNYLKPANESSKINANESRNVHNIAPETVFDPNKNYMNFQKPISSDKWNKNSLNNIRFNQNHSAQFSNYPLHIWQQTQWNNSLYPFQSYPFFHNSHQPHLSKNHPLPTDESDNNILFHYNANSHKLKNDEESNQKNQTFEFRGSNRFPIPHQHINIPHNESPHYGLQFQYRNQVPPQNLKEQYAAAPNPFCQSQINSCNKSFIQSYGSHKGNSFAMPTNNIKTHDESNHNLQYQSPYIPAMTTDFNSNQQNQKCFGQQTKPIQFPAFPNNQNQLDKNIMGNQEQLSIPNLANSLNSNKNRIQANTLYEFIQDNDSLINIDPNYDFRNHYNKAMENFLIAPTNYDYQTNIATLRTDQEAFDRNPHNTPAFLFKNDSRTDQLQPQTQENPSFMDALNTDCCNNFPSLHPFCKSKSVLPNISNQESFAVGHKSDGRNLQNPMDNSPILNHKECANTIKNHSMDFEKQKAIPLMYNRSNLMFEAQQLQCKITDDDQSNNFNYNYGNPKSITTINNNERYDTNPSMSFKKKQGQLVRDEKALNLNLAAVNMIYSNRPNEALNNPLVSFGIDKIIHFVKLIETLENGFFIDRYQIVDSELVKLSQLISESPEDQLFQYDSIDKIMVNFNELLKFQASFTGVFGRLLLITKCLSENGFIKPSEVPLWENYFKSNGSGLYLILVSNDFHALKFLIILYSSDDDFDNVNSKKGIVQLLRYMTQLCNTNILAIDERDVNLISFELSNQVVRPMKFIPQTIKKEEDKCELLNESTWELGLPFERLIGKGKHVGFYTKKFCNGSHVRKPLKYEWRNKNHYNDFFSKNSVNVDGLQNPPSVNFMNSFLRTNFCDDLREIEEFIDSELEQYSETNKELIEQKVNFEVQVKKCFYVIQFLKQYEYSIYTVLEKMTDLKEYFSEEMANAIELAFKIKDSANLPQGFSLASIYDKVNDGILLATDKMAVLQIISKTNYLKDFDLEEYLASQIVFSKKKLYETIIEKSNKDFHLLYKPLMNWRIPFVVNKIKSIKLSKEFNEKYSREWMDDAQTLFTKVYERIDEFFSVKSARSKIRESILQAEQAALREHYYFCQIKEKLQKGSGNSNVYLNSMYSEKSYFGSDKIFISYDLEELVESYYEFDIHQFKLSKQDSDRADQDQSFVIRPKPEKLMTIKLPASFEVVDFFFIKNKKIAMITNSNKGSELKFYDIAKPSENLIIYYFGHKIFKADYNETENKMIFFSKTETNASIILYFISDNFLIRNDATVDLDNRFGIKEVKSMRLGKLNEVFLIDDQNQIRKIDYNSLTGERIATASHNVVDMAFVTSTNCLLLISKNKIIPYIVNTKTLLPEIALDTELNTLNFVMAKFNAQTQLLFNRGNKINTKLLHCALSTENYGLVKCPMSSKINQAQVKSSLSVFDYLQFMYEKYAIYYPLQRLEIQNISQNLVVYLSGDMSKNTYVEASIMRKLKEIQTSIKKPFMIEVGLTSNTVLLHSSGKNTEYIRNHYCEKNLNQWICDLICLVPMQISRCENNQYIILNKGVPMKLDELNTLYEVKDKINLGLFESVFNNWNKNIIVISSMGKQSTGKSYTLNHVSGSTFSIAGDRCTDGCWLSIRMTDDCLYVLMDFEGLGSFERSEQEDMLLSIQNATLSNLTIFKAEASINKDTDRMFNRFNQGANMLKGDNNIFQGTFCIMIKDILKTDVEDIRYEFKQKMITIIEREQKKNFISAMYKNGYLIWPFPPLTNDDYYQEMTDLANCIRNDIKPTYNNGGDFMNMLKTIMAKMSIEDFTSLSNQEFNHRIHILNQSYVDALTFGKLSDSVEAKTHCNLKCFEANSKAIIDEATVSVCSSSGDMFDIHYKDSQINLNNGSKNLITILNSHIQKSSTNHIQWSEILKSFMKQAIEKRIERVMQWIEVNLEKWSQVPDFQENIAGFKNLTSYKAREIQAINQICKTNCESCNSSCVLLMNHSEKHACESFDHKCIEVCEYCLNDNINVSCSLPFGHFEKHACLIRQHTCGIDCKYEMCKNKCVEKTKHIGEHKCALKQHNCSQTCSLKECKNRCQISADKEHTVHKCVNDQCMKLCEVQDCKIRCAWNNHFHGEQELSRIFKIENQIEKTTDFIIGENEAIDCDFHCCGNDHLCEETCSEPGYCHVITERKIVEKEFCGERDTFRFQKQFQNIGSTLKCCKNIPKFEKQHLGDHLHTLDASFIHSCMERCPTCNGICEKQYGHNGKHHTTHGNMENHYFISDQEAFDVGDHKYVIGESSVAEMCHMFCNKLGRGHIHVIECNQTKEDCNNNEEGKRRHQTCLYGPDIETTKDEIKHEDYWNLINFEDPCLQVDIEAFSKCPFYCGHEDHKNDDEKQYCQLDLWHNRVTSLDEIQKTTGVISSDGHYFECSHNLKTSGYHFVLCLDISGSMDGQPWEQLKSSAKDFCLSRTSSTVDRLSIVLFDDYPNLMCQNIPFNQFVVNQHLVYRGGGTDFAHAINLCIEVFSGNIHNSLTPILIFMSDGACDNGNPEILQLRVEFESKGLKSFFIGFGSIQPKLQEFAKLIGGQYFTSIGGVQLRESFMEISSKFGTTISVMKSHK